MGGSEHSMPKFNWTFIRRDDHHEIYQNEFGALVEKNVVLNDPKLDEEEELESYYYRYSTKKPIVRTYRADYDTDNGFCSNHKNITVFTEYIPFRLIDARNLTHEQGLYVLSESLHGFHELFVKLGSFKIEDTMVGFNKDGFVRVWHNPDFAQNHFENNKVVLMSTANPHKFDERVVTKQEEETAEDIWHCVDKHATFRPNFRNQVQASQPLNFYNLRDIVDEEIRREKYVPSNLNLEDKHGIVRSSREIMSQSNINHPSLNHSSNQRASYNNGSNQNISSNNGYSNNLSARNNNNNNNSNNSNNKASANNSYGDNPNNSYGNQNNRENSSDNYNSNANNNSYGDNKAYANINNNNVNSSNYYRKELTHSRQGDNLNNRETTSILNIPKNYNRDSYNHYSVNQGQI